MLIKIFKKIFRKNNSSIFDEDDELERPAIRKKLEEMKLTETDRFRKAAITVLLGPADGNIILQMPEVIDVIENDDPGFEKLADTIFIIRRELGI